MRISIAAPDHVNIDVDEILNEASYSEKQELYDALVDECGDESSDVLKNVTVQSHLENNQIDFTNYADWGRGSNELSSHCIIKIESLHDYLKMKPILNMLYTCDIDKLEALYEYSKIT